MTDTPQHCADGPRGDRAAADWRAGEVSYRLPTLAEMRGVRMLLPEMMTSARRVAAWVGVAGASQKIVGAAALSLDDARGAEDEGLIQVRVVGPRAGRGIERELLRQAADAAVAAGRRGLVSIDWLELNSATAVALAEAGFRPLRHRYEYEGRFAEALEALGPLYREVLDHGWIPAGARIVPLVEADGEAVADVHVRHFGGDRVQAVRMLAGDPPWHCDRRLSFVLLLDGRVIGYTLGQVLPDQNVCEFDWTAIEPAYRGGWANLWLRTHAAEQLLAAGVENYRYRALDEHADSQRAARRAKSRLVRTAARMGKAF